MPAKPNETPTQNQTVIRVDSLDRSVTLRRLRAMDKVEVGIRQAAMLRGVNPTNINEEAQGFSYMLCNLMVALVEPSDFPFHELEDDDLLKLWKEWTDWGSSFRKAQ